MKAFVGVVALGFAAIALVMFLRDGRETFGNGSTIASHAGGVKVGDSITPASVLRIAPRSTTAYVPAPAPRRSPLATEMSQAKAWKTIYERLRDTPEGKTAEGSYYLAQILAACANVTDRRGPQPSAPRTPEEARGKFLASISERDPQRAARLAAYDSNASRESRCADLRGIATTEKEIRELREQSAAAGDPKARALLASEDIFATARTGMGPGNLPTITDAQLETLREAARSGDPAALQIVGSVLASTMGNLDIRTGPDEQPVDPRAFHNAWVLLACEAGANCGPDSQRVAAACAYQGQCGVDNVRDYFFFYENSPAQAQQLSAYRQQLQNAIITGDWSWFHFTRNAPSGSGHSVFRFGSG
jgi:hypothetical protein